MSAVASLNVARVNRCLSPSKTGAGKPYQPTMPTRRAAAGSRAAMLSTHRLPTTTSATHVDCFLLKSQKSQGLLLSRESSAPWPGARTAKAHSSGVSQGS